MMNSFPILALSVRQPWAWAIIHAGKDVENRTPSAIKQMPRFKGRIAIHASKAMLKWEYEMARDFMRGIGVDCPPAGELLRAGIIGSVEIYDVCAASESKWWFGPRGICLRDPMPCEFIPSVGQLGLFRWKPASSSIVPPPARWMLTPAGVKQEAFP